MDPEAPSAEAEAEDKVYTAALLIIGNEVLSGRTQDANTSYLGKSLNDAGIRLREVRIVPDDHDAIGAAVNAIRVTHDYVFTTGGIGPTHDDIIAEAVARAFGVRLIAHPEALARLERHYAPGEFNAARRRMALIPEGAELIDNPVSAAPGFRIGNVHVLAGVPRIMRAMFEGMRHRLVGGRPLLSRTVRTNLPEGRLAERLADLQRGRPEVDIGSYPTMGVGGPGVRLVLRSVDAPRLELATGEVLALIAALGGTAEEIEIAS